ncbi:MAG: T9SS type A sorting domain-containing protein [Flavobacteriaceae bacterium]|nr:T9SS type A sorting domain-containing protein [Flavobacteriaceae bacterium]
MPVNPILCPNESDTLWTQSYDSYQWYKDGNLIPGETNQYLVIDNTNYGLSNITVEATDAGCSELSPSVLVDGWIFVPPVVTSGGDYNFNSVTGVIEVCLNDTITFEFSSIYDSNIQWTADGNPLSGETSSLIEITSSDTTGIVNYNVCGSPKNCPNYLQCLGVPLYVQFVECATLSIEDNIRFDLNYRIYPNPSNSFVTIKSNFESFGRNYTITDQLGRIVLSGYLMSEYTKINIQEFSSGIYFIKIGNNNTFRLIKE